MKKMKYLVLIILIVILSGCNVQTNTTNEIYNKAYDVDINIVEFQDAIVAVGEKCNKGIIGVTNYTTNGFSLIINATGSGFIYEGYAILKDGSTVSLEDSINRNVKSYTYKAVTNYHVIEGGRKIAAYFGEQYDEAMADVLAYDKKQDIAIISFSTSLYLTPLVFGDSDNIKMGHFAIAIGSPTGYEFFNSLTFGIVSSPNRVIEDDYGRNLFIQTDVAINPGNSGGPLLNIKGEVIGVNTMKFVDDEIESMGFSIPINLVKEFIKRNVK